MNLISCQHCHSHIEYTNKTPVLLAAIIKPSFVLFFSQQKPCLWLKVEQIELRGHGAFLAVRGTNPSAEVTTERGTRLERENPLVQMTLTSG